MRIKRPRPSVVLKSGASNPWLAIPLEDYEGHMNSAGVAQLGVLSELFGEALESCCPRSVAVLGVAGGNGLERIDCSVIRRVVGVDINPEYLRAVDERFSGKLNLELHRLDLSREATQLEPVDLVHVALLFEHAGLGCCLKQAMSLVAPGGSLSVVLQLPGDSAANVGPSAFPSVQSLASHFSLVDPLDLQRRIVDFKMVGEMRRELPGGKGFWMGIFRREVAAPGAMYLK